MSNEYESDEEFYQEVDVDDLSGDDEEFAEVNLDTEDAEEGGINEDFATTMHALEAKKQAEQKKKEQEKLKNATSLKPKSKIRRQPEVVDDFIRNFLVQYNMAQTLEVFQNEWYEKQMKNELPQEQVIVPDIYLQNTTLEEQVNNLREELHKSRKVSSTSKNAWDKLKKERDHHKMHHQRVMVEKKNLMKEIKRLKKHCNEYEPVLIELRKRYKKALKEKMLMRLERDRLSARVESLEVQLENGDDESIKSKSKTKKKKKHTTTGPINQGEGLHHTALKAIEKLLPEEDRPNPYWQKDFKATRAEVEGFSLADSFKGHTMAVSAIALHPSKNIVASVSDDTTWKLWNVPDGTNIMSGDGHESWLSSCDFHPAATHLATTSGDGTVKVWDFYNQCCSATYTGHAQAVWTCAFHDKGDILASGSIDHTAKLWDVRKNKCVLTLRGQHKDSVNHVAWQPFTNILCTVSGDHTVCLWDSRVMKCIATLYGHDTAVNHAEFSARGDRLVSGDAEGFLFFWDIRMVQEFGSYETGNSMINSFAMDLSSETLAVATSEANIKVLKVPKDGNVESIEAQADLVGHEDAVQDIIIDRQNKFMVSVGSDAMVRYWS
mmetsp:Transcript_7562/g.11222  ORF Transcript_7562/g.11222 Transcript_7562/m.11222 type:complete len:606 (-) Transcript_7562:1753-3570(-)